MYSNHLTQMFLVLMCTKIHVSTHLYVCVQCRYMYIYTHIRTYFLYHVGQKNHGRMYTRVCAYRDKYQLLLKCEAVL